MKRHAFKVNSITLYSQVAIKNTQVVRQSLIFLWSRCNLRRFRKNFATMNTNSESFKNVLIWVNSAVLGAMFLSLLFSVQSYNFSHTKWPSTFISWINDIYKISDPLIYILHIQLLIITNLWHKFPKKRMILMTLQHKFSTR